MESNKRSYARRAEYLKKAVVRRRREVREKAIAHLGGQCQICGYKRCEQALDFHHRNHKEKTFGISQKGYTRSWERVKEELKGCVFLCANCHREIHAGYTQLLTEMSE
ncbi:TPA: hypothetical protein DEP34_02900 [Candidatus Uhrbacteria bacterium]|nr:hypothetical protein [Candidatus Uhrbacteria bacterium]HCB19311.1 hypothetical protein [Candidatus Uhrbacteria bacterium]